MKPGVLQRISVLTVFLVSCLQTVTETPSVPDLPEEKPDSVELLISTFRGSPERNFYGRGSINGLQVVWKFYLGKGKTVISRKLGEREWAGAGWTGQPLLVRENEDTFLIQGSYDHKLRKINSQTGEEVWNYSFDDVIKGTGTLWINASAADPLNSVVVLQGSRLGITNFLDSKHIPSFRAVSYFTGKELWRYDVPFTNSYSRDTDGSPLILNDTLYLGLESGLLAVMDPDPVNATFVDSMLQPQVLEIHKLYNKSDIKTHGGNLVTESSPVLLGNRIYIAAGSGHVYGYNLETREIDWDFFIGSDLDGTIVVTRDSCLLVSVEKQYIPGKGGLFKLDPSKSPEYCVVWFLAVSDNKYASWEGGVIGTPAVNDRYAGDSLAALGVVTALDGYTYFFRYDSIMQKPFQKGPDAKKTYPQPYVIRKLRTGPSIASPIITSDRILVAGYNGLFLFGYNTDLETRLIDYKPGMFEASPIIWGNRAYIADRGGFLYCLGEIHEE